MIASDWKSNAVKIVVGITVILFLSNINAIVDCILHPQIPYFDLEHIIVGATSAFFCFVFFGILFVYVIHLKNINKERTILLNEVIKAKNRAEENDRLKTAFLNNISHEIRTPFNGILGFLSIIQENDLTDNERKRYFTIINKSSDRLLKTINDIVEISQIQTGQINLKITETNLSKLSGELKDQFSPKAESKGLRFNINYTLTNAAGHINTDKEKLNSILSNLIDNAIKFTKAGSIELCIRSDDDNLKFSVQDTGIGIAKDKHQIIFDRFVQADVSETRHYEGSGLGLSIARSYVELLGGKIWLASEEGQGSTFFVTLPYHAVMEKIPPNITEAYIEDKKGEIKKMKILIVEDDETSQLFITKAIQKNNIEVLEVSSGAEAIDACRKSPDIDLILMDIKMPGIDGYEATRQIRLFNKDVVIIAQTASGLIGDREKAIEAGCNDYLSKPVKKEKLIALIQHHFDNT